MVSHETARLAQAVAQAAAFAATVPLIPGSATPKAARAALTVVLIPLLYDAAPLQVARPALSAALAGGLEGALFGLSASVIAGAVNAAGDAIDASLGSPPFIERLPSGGPIARLYQLAYATVLFQTGGFTIMVSALARATSGVHSALTLHGLAALGGASIRTSLAIAGPSLLAQALATVTAGIFSRIAPQIGGVLFSTPLISGAVLVTLAMGAVVLRSEFTEIVRQTVASVTGITR